MTALTAALADVVRAPVGLDDIAHLQHQPQCLLTSFDMYLQPLTRSPNS